MIFGFLALGKQGSREGSYADLHIFFCTMEQ